MNNSKNTKIGLLGLLLLLVVNGVQATTDKKIIAYFPEWGVHLLRPYYVKNIVDSESEAHLTVLNYAFVVPGQDASGDIVCQFDDPDAAYQQFYGAGISVDGIADITDGSQVLFGHFNQLKKLKNLPTTNPNLKIVIAIGGWLGSTWFSDAALTATSRETFVASCIDLFINGNLPVVGVAGGLGAAEGIFDGFDIDWEYPITGGNGGTHSGRSIIGCI